MRRVHCPIMPAEAKAANSDAWLSQKGYWHDGAAYIATPAEAAELHKAVKTLTACFAEAMDRVVASRALLERFRFSNNRTYNFVLQNLCARSWKDQTQHSYPIDRYDFAWNGGAPKLLERNFGNLGLIESTGVTQEEYAAWLRAMPGFADVKTAGDLKTCFIEAFNAVAADRGLTKQQRITLTVLGRKKRDAGYDPGQLYAEIVLQEWIKQAEFPVVARSIATDGLGYINNAKNRKMAQAAGMGLFPFAALESCLHDQALSTIFGTELVPLVPAWTILAGHKGMLPLLSSMFPDCPYILPARAGNQPLAEVASIIKFSLGCQGEESRIHDANGKMIHDHRGLRPMMDEHRFAANFIAQALAPETRNQDGSNKVLHVFTTNGVMAAAGMREAPGPIVGGGKKTGTQYVPLLIRDRDDDAPAAYPCDDPQPVRAKPRLRDLLAYWVGLSEFKP